MKRMIFPTVFIAVMAGVGAVGGVLYPYTELIFDSDLSQSQSSAHVDTMMIDNAELAKERACVGARYGVGMTLLVLGMGAYRRRGVKTGPPPGPQ